MKKSLRFASAALALTLAAEMCIRDSKKEIQEVPAGELPGVHIVLVCGLWQGASGWAYPVFLVCV